MIGKKGVFILIGILSLYFIPSVSAANGCNAADLECGSIPTDNCDVRVNTTFVFSNYSLEYGIDVCASEVVLDCNGATLEFTNTFPPIGNSTTYGLSTGIKMDGKYNNTITNCRLLSFLRGIEIYSGTGNVLSNNVINSSIWYPSFFQFMVAQLGINMVGTHNNTLLRNQVLNNEYYGIYLVNSDYNNIVQNNISSNHFGVRVHYSNYNSFIDNGFFRNAQGVDSAGASFNVFKHNRIYFSVGSGIRISASGEGSDPIFLESNTVCFNRQFGNIGQAKDISITGVESMGVNNTCDTVGEWNDVNVSGCTFSCPPLLKVEGNPHLGNTINLTMFYRRHAGVPYVLAFAFNTSPGIDLGDGRIVPLNNDLLFQATFDPLIAPAYGLLNSQGVMSNNGKATAILTIPNQTSLAGLKVYTAFGLINSSATYPYNVINFSQAVPITILP